MNLPGVVQTVPRAELYALQFLMNEAIESAQIEFITDNKKNYDTFNLGPIAGSRSVNHDLFSAIFNCTKNKRLQVVVRWMPSHLQDKMSGDDFQLPKNVSLNDVQGNQWADDVAGEMAKSLELPLNVSSPYLYYKNLTKRIQRRLMVILCSLPNRPKHVPKATIHRESFEELCHESNHILYKFNDNKYMGCARCKQIKLIKGIGVRFWLSGLCLPRGSDEDIPIPLHREFIQIGTLSIHISHKPYVYKGVHYCINCGCYATNKLKKLASECQARTVAGQRFLNNINKGILPDSARVESLSQQEQIILSSVQNSVNIIHANLCQVSEAESEHESVPPQAPLVGNDSDSD